MLPTTNNHLSPPGHPGIPVHIGSGRTASEPRSAKRHGRLDTKPRPKRGLAVPVWRLKQSTTPPHPAPASVTWSEQSWRGITRPVTLVHKESTAQKLSRRQPHAQLLRGTTPVAAHCTCRWSHLACCCRKTTPFPFEEGLTGHSKVKYLVCDSLPVAIEAATPIAWVAVLGEFKDEPRGTRHAAPAKQLGFAVKNRACDS